MVESIRSDRAKLRAGHKTMRRASAWRWGAIVTVGVVFLSGCSADPGPPKDPGPSSSAWTATEQSAIAEGSVVIYTGQPPTQMDRIKAAFEADYPGITLTYIRGGGGEMQPRFDQEREAKSGEADVYESANPFYLNKPSANKELADLTGPNLDNATFTEFPKLRQAKNTVTPFAIGFNLVWNTDLVKKGLKGYEDLVDRAKEFSGQVAIPDLYADSIAAYYASVELGTGDGYVEKLLAMKPQLHATSVTLVQAVAAGEAKVGIFAPTSTIKDLKGQGAPLGDVAPAAKSNYSAVYQVGTPAWANHPNAAQVYINWLLSDTGQKLLGDQGYLTALPNIKGAAGGPDGISFPTEEMGSPANGDSYRKRFAEARG